MNFLKKLFSAHTLEQIIDQALASEIAELINHASGTLEKRTTMRAEVNPMPASEFADSPKEIQDDESSSACPSEVP